MQEGRNSVLGVQRAVRVGLPTGLSLAPFPTAATVAVETSGPTPYDLSCLFRTTPTARPARDASFTPDARFLIFLYFEQNVLVLGNHGGFRFRHHEAPSTAARDCWRSTFLRILPVEVLGNAPKCIAFGHLKCARRSRQKSINSCSLTTASSLTST